MKVVATKWEIAAALVYFAFRQSRDLMVDPSTCSAGRMGCSPRAIERLPMATAAITVSAADLL